MDIYYGLMITKETKRLQHLVLCLKDNEFHAAFSISMDAYSFVGFVEFVEVMSVLSFHSKRQEDFIQRDRTSFA